MCQDLNSTIALTLFLLFFSLYLANDCHHQLMISSLVPQTGGELKVCIPLHNPSLGNWHFLRSDGTPPVGIQRDADRQSDNEPTSPAGDAQEAGQDGSRTCRHVFRLLPAFLHFLHLVLLHLSRVNGQLQ